MLIRGMPSSKPQAIETAVQAAVVPVPERTFWTQDGQWRGLQSVEYDRYNTPYVEAWGTELDRYPFQWWITLTFDPKRFPRLSAQAAWRALGKLCKHIRKQNGYQPQFFAVLAYQRNGMPHFHVLMLNVGCLSYVAESKFWQAHYGHAEFQAYNPRMAARYYSAAQYSVAQGHGAVLEVSRGLGKYRRNGSESVSFQALDRFRKVFNVVLECRPGLEVDHAKA